MIQILENLIVGLFGFFMQFYVMMLVIATLWGFVEFFMKETKT